LGQWIQGGANVAPVANADHVNQGETLDLNLPVDEDDAHDAAIDVNMLPEERLEILYPANAIDQEILQASELGQC
jgi:hypothetical protein